MKTTTNNTNHSQDTTHSPCHKCQGEGTHLDYHRWSDGLGGVDAVCGRCGGSGTEPTVDALLSKLDAEAQAKATMRHAAFMMMRGVLSRSDVDGYGVGWQAMQAAWLALDARDRGLIQRQTGKAWSLRRKRVIAADAAAA